MDRRIARFRGQIEAHFGGRPGRGARYPASLRTEAVEIASEDLAGGAGLARVAGELGLGPVTLRRWIEAAAHRPRQLRPVEVVEGARPGEREAGESLVLVTATGHRVEGLALAEVALLLEALGCSA